MLHKCMCGQEYQSLCKISCKNNVFWLDDGPAKTVHQRARGIKGTNYGRVRRNSGGGGYFVILTRLGVILPLVVPQTGALATFL